MPGPAPKDPASRRRRNTATGKTRLPAAGRTGSAPRWPLDTAARPKPTKLWTYLWKLPQAMAWERDGIVRVVARYALLLNQIETGDQKDVSAALLGEVRQMEDRLGLNPKAMRSLLWEVADDEVGEKRAEQEAGTAADTARSRLRVV